MKDTKNFFWFKGSKNTPKAQKPVLQRDKDGYSHVAMHSRIFSDMSENILATNSMYSELKEDINASIEPYSTKEKIILDVFETKASDEFARETALIGFKRYVNACLAGLKKQLFIRLALFFSLLLVGVLIEFILYGLNQNSLTGWGFKSIEVVATLFIWQFGGYLAFELPGEVKAINRCKQILNLKYEFKIWD